MKRKILTFVVVFAFVFGPAFFAVTKSAFALGSFGGRIYWTQPCQCPVPGYLIWVGPPVAASVLYTSGSVLYPNFNIFTRGNWVLGLHSGTPIACGFYSTFGGCNVHAYGNGIIRIVGTS